MCSSDLVRADAAWLDAGLATARIVIGFYDADFATALTNGRSDPSLPFFAFGGNLAFAQAEQIDLADADGALERSFTLAADLQTLWLSDQADVVVVDTGPARLDGRAGNDTLIGTSGADILHGGSGNDLLAANAPALVGTSGFSELLGDDGNDLLAALAGHVQLTGGAEIGRAHV